MKKKCSVILCKALILICFCILNFQAQISSNNKIPPPSEEVFEPAFGQVSTANGVKTKSKDRYRTYDQVLQDIIRIYNADGSVWWEFSFNENSPLFFSKNPKKDFKPYGKFTTFIIHLRLKAVSKHWYEVIVNEETQTTKYTLIDDPVMGCGDFEPFIMDSGNIKFNYENNPMLATPNGKKLVINYHPDDRYFTKQIKGDWVQVKSEIYQIYGWVRWRKGEDIIVGYLLNDHIVPK